MFAGRVVFVACGSTAPAYATAPRQQWRGAFACAPLLMHRKLRVARLRQAPARAPRNLLRDREPFCDAGLLLDRRGRSIMRTISAFVFASLLIALPAAAQPSGEGSGTSAPRAATSGATVGVSPSGANATNASRSCE